MLLFCFLFAYRSSLHFVHAGYTQIDIKATEHIYKLMVNLYYWMCRMAVIRGLRLMDQYIYFVWMTRFLSPPHHQCLEALCVMFHTTHVQRHHCKESFLLFLSTYEGHCLQRTEWQNKLSVQVTSLFCSIRRFRCSIFIFLRDFSFNIIRMWRGLSRSTV